MSISIVLHVLIYQYLLFCAFIWFYRKMKVFHSLLNQSHSVWTVSLGINTLVWHSCCNISEHRFQLSMAFFFRYLKLTFFQYLQKNLIFSLKYRSLWNFHPNEYWKSDIWILEHVSQMKVITCMHVPVNKSLTDCLCRTLSLNLHFLQLPP